MIWPLFVMLAVGCVGLLLWGRRLDVGSGVRTAVRRLAEAGHSSLRPPHPGQVRGRERELAELERLLERPQGRLAVLCATGGMGKTTVAAQLAAQAEQVGCAVFWIRWRGTTQLAQQLTQVAVACGLGDEELQAARAGQANLPDVVWRQLAQARRWLVVVDNADEPEAIGPDGERIADYRGWIRPDGGGLLLITSRDAGAQTWGACAHIVPLAPLTPAPAGQVLLDAAPQAGSVAEAEELADRLGGLPLALRAAGAYLATPTSRYRTLRAYQQALAAEMPDLLGAEHPHARDPDTARRVVRHTWELSLDQLARDGIPLARPLLRLLALLASAPIPLTLITPGLLATVTGQPVTAVMLEAAFAGLHRYGLLDTPTPNSATPGAPGDDTIAQVALHPLIREISALALATDTADLTSWYQAIAERLSINVDEIGQIGRPGWPTAALLAPHLVYLHGPAITQPFVSSRHVLQVLGRVLREAGAHALQLVVAQRALQADMRALGPDHPDTLTSRNGVATALYLLGEHREAERLYRRNLEDRARVLGSDHLDTLTSRNGVATALYLLGEYREAEELHRQTLQDRIRVLGPDHPETLRSRNNLANTMHELGEYREAERLHRQTLQDRIRVLGPDHPDTLRSRNNLATALWVVRMYREAEDLHRQNLQDRIRVLGPDHPDTLTSRNGIAMALHFLGEYQGAEQLHRQNLQDRIRVLGPDHPDTLITRYNLASALFRRGEYREAEDLHRQNLDDFTRVLGADHPHTLDSRRGLERIVAASRTSSPRRLRRPPRPHRRTPPTP
ncbi:FxSxx-COOH system tetratricopeptide repeat protein [Streptomyces sp. NBC_00390]|uniref:FxSxx-COOH system tetratricopeptide repeat protein n=1 Tax=Streptomyces sp. NBC_00390 TaxID=2975736 RepID=UPI002E1ED954